MIRPVKPWGRALGVGAGAAACSSSQSPSQLPLAGAPWSQQQSMAAIAPGCSPDPPISHPQLGPPQAWINARIRPTNAESAYLMRLL